MKKISPSDTKSRDSFIQEFAFGDKALALTILIAEAKASHRFDSVHNDDFIYDTMATWSI